MKSELENRYKLALEILVTLSKQASALGETLVFIGGTAVQLRLKQNKRLSIDLEFYYSEDNGELLKVLEPEFKVSKNKSFNEEFFDFYVASKGDLKVKIDFTKINLSKYEKFYSQVIVLNTQVKVGSPDYLIAAKLSTLPIGTIGRRFSKPDFKMAFLKDIFDCNALLEEYSLSKNALEFFKEIVKDENEIKNTSYSLEEVLQSAYVFLINEANFKQQKEQSKKTLLVEFANYSSKIDLWTYALMTSRLAVYFKLLTLDYANAPSAVKKLEEIAMSKWRDRLFMKNCKENLEQNGFSKDYITSLITSPQSKAVIYLYYCFNLL